MGERRESDTVVVGTGFSGLGMAIRLRTDGRDDFVVLEKADDLGGTWRDNTYPGCACDVPSHLYSYSFAQNPGWTRSFSGQPEILDYLRGIAERHDLLRSIHFGVAVTGARWDADEQRWHVATAAGDDYVCRYLVAGVGALHLPHTPELPGVGSFRGERFHSARWNHDYDLTGKRVAVIGTGASAIQFVPRIAPHVAELHLFQRTAPWVMPKPDHPMPSWARTVFDQVPLAQRAYRTLLYWMLEARAIGFNNHHGLLKVAQRVAERNIRRHVDDPRLRAELTPDYLLGCKRVLISNDYYPTFARDNVHLVTDRIADVREHSIVDSTGVRREVDAIIYGTGFHVTDAFDHLDITGRDGLALNELWAAHGMQTYKGITVRGFPNAFFLLGPNTGLGHNSVVLMIESQIRYVSAAMRLADRRGAGAMEVTEAAQRDFQADIQGRLRRGIWTQGGCTSWYLDAEGVNRTIWPGFTFQYRAGTREVDQAAYEFTAVHAPRPTSAA